MLYPRNLVKGDCVGICAPSSGLLGDAQSKRMDNAINNIKALGYDVIETASVRKDSKCVSADSETRAIEFMELYENPNVALILPPCGVVSSSWICFHTWILANWLHYLRSGFADIQIYQH